VWRRRGGWISTLQNGLWWKFSKIHQTLTPDGLVSTDKRGAQGYTGTSRQCVLSAISLFIFTCHDIVRITSENESSRSSLQCSEDTLVNMRSEFKTIHYFQQTLLSPVLLNLSQLFGDTSLPFIL